jgi:hypothetical protein
MRQLNRWILTGALAVLAVPTLAAACPGNREKIAEARTQAFAAADGDEDGALNREEFETFKEEMRSRLAEAHFAKLDADGDERVTEDELEEARPRRHRRRGHGGF